MESKAKEAKRIYNRQYRAKNAERLRQYHKEWSRNNPDKVKAAQIRYWQKQGEKLTEAKGES